MALSADARTLVVGAPGWSTGDSEGYVKVYRADEDGGNRVQLGQTIYGNAPGDVFGKSVDITADGNSIVVGSPGNEYRQGYLQVVSLDSSDDASTGTWKQVGQNITGETIRDQFWWSVSISDDGKTIAVGAAQNDENGDHVRIHRLEDVGTSWKQIGEDIDGKAAGDYYSGTLVSLSANGSIVAIGAPQAANNTGQVKVYQIESAGSSWEQLGESIYGDNEYGFLGQSLNISPDGYSLAIGSPGSSSEDDFKGYVSFFSLESDVDLGTARWKQIGKNIYWEANGDGFGSSVSLSDDAKTLTIGAPRKNVCMGQARVYQMDDSKVDYSRLSWIQLGDDINGEAIYDFLGESVSLSADGSKVAIGSLYGNYDNGYESGQVRVFVME